MSSLDTLFTPFKINALTLPNRVVMAPMTRSASPGGVPTEQVAAYYRRRAENGVGLIITEGAGIGRPASVNEPDVPRFYGEEPMAGWKRVVESVHAAGGRIVPQLWHVGNRRSGQTPDWAPPSPYESPSGVINPGEPAGEPMSDSAVADTIAAFARAAADAEALGFDGIEIHAAHGYLIDQFFWDRLNLRSDVYGGAGIGQRSRFAVEILKAIRADVSKGFPVIVRLSQWKRQDFSARIAGSPQEMGEWLGALADAGADAFHCSQRRFWEPEFPALDAELNFAGWAKRLTGRPSITVGSVGLSGELYASIFNGESSVPVSLDLMLARLDRGDFDLVAVGRALLSDPAWLRKVREGRTSELMAYTPEALGSLA